MSLFQSVREDVADMFEDNQATRPEQILTKDEYLNQYTLEGERLKSVNAHRMLLYYWTYHEGALARDREKRRKSPVKRDKKTWYQKNKDRICAEAKAKYHAQKALSLITL